MTELPEHATAVAPSSPSSGEASAHHEVAISVRWRPRHGCFVASSESMFDIGADSRAEAVRLMDEEIQRRLVLKARLGGIRSSPERIKANHLAASADATNAFADVLFGAIYAIQRVYRVKMKETLRERHVDRFTLGKDGMSRRFSALTYEELMFLEAVRSDGRQGLSDVAERVGKDLKYAVRIFEDLVKRGFVRRSESKRTIKNSDDNERGRKATIAVRPIYLTDKSFVGLLRINEVRCNVAATLLENCTPSLTARADIVNLFRRLRTMIDRNIMGPGLKESRVDALLREVHAHPEWSVDEIDEKFAALPGVALREDYEHLFVRRGHPLGLMST